jgi:hypothetical protein
LRLTGLGKRLQDRDRCGAQDRAAHRGT